MLQRLGLYEDEFGRLRYGWVEPYQLWLPFEHLDFLWSNVVRSKETFWRGYR